MVERNISKETVEGIIQRVPFIVVWEENEQRRQYLLQDNRTGENPPDFIKIITTHDPDNLNIVHVITAMRKNDPHETSSEVGGRRKKRKTVKKRKPRKTVKNKKKKRTKKSVKNKKRATRKRT